MKVLSAVLALACASLFLASCSAKRPSQSAHLVNVPTPVEHGGDVGLKDHPVRVTGGDRVKAALEALISESKSPIPDGTKLQQVKVEDGVARIAFSKEFNKLENAGDTGESLAQNALRRTLAQFREIDKMLVLVDGKPFESEHADWSKPIAVRDEEGIAQRIESRGGE